jgi:hypothetical protein
MLGGWPTFAILAKVGTHAARARIFISASTNAGTDKCGQMRDKCGDDKCGQMRGQTELTPFSVTTRDAGLLPQAHWSTQRFVICVFGVICG